jgi:hypothetical protein
VGMLNVGCLMLLAGGGGGACRMTGAFVEEDAGGAPATLTLVSGMGVRELMKNMTKSAMTGMTISSANTMTPSRVKRR